MIPIISIAKSMLDQFKRYYKIIAVFIIMILTAFLFHTNSKLKKAQQDLDRAVNNYEYYQQLADTTKQNNKLLQLTVDEFKQSNDSLIQKIKETQKKLKIKDKQIDQTTYIQTEIIHDTTVVIKDKDFDVVIKPNELTTIEIQKQDSLLTHKLDIQNDQTLFITSKKVYRNKYKNWFKRLIHFDFKKKIAYEYQIYNTNDLIDINNTRLIEISK